jgi:hypothetical protein
MNDYCEMILRDTIAEHSPALRVPGSYPEVKAVEGSCLIDGKGQTSGRQKETVSCRKPKVLWPSQAGLLCTTTALVFEKLKNAS